MDSNLPKNFSSNNLSSGAANADLPKNLTPNMMKGQDASQSAPRKPEVTCSTGLRFVETAIQYE